MEKGGIFWEGGVASRSVAYSWAWKRGYIVRGRSTFWEGHIQMFKGDGVNIGREEQILRESHIDV